jgi:cytochrome oxidase assembly protein ShyY1
MLRGRALRLYSMLCKTTLHSHTCISSKYPIFLTKNHLSSIAPNQENPSNIAKNQAAPANSANCTANKAVNCSSKRDYLGIAVFVSLSLITLNLGIWQYNRREWKINLIKSTEEKLNCSNPVELTTLLLRQSQTTNSAESQESDAEFTPVRVSGVLNRAKTVLIGPRPPPANINTQAASANPLNAPKGSSQASLINLIPSKSGYFVISPLFLPSLDAQILVNRGWVDRSYVNQLLTAKNEQEIVDVVGITRKSEARPRILPNSSNLTTDITLDKTSYFYLDIPRIAQELLTGQRAASETMMVDLVDESSPNNNPSANGISADGLLIKRPRSAYLQFATTPLTHAIYSATWCMLTGALLGLTWYRFKRSAAVRKPSKLPKQL